MERQKLSLKDALPRLFANDETLTCLDSCYNNIGDDGAKDLAKALTKNSILTELYLESNAVGSLGAKALAEALSKNSSLKVLNLKHSRIGDEGAKAFADALTKNSSLTLLYLSYTGISDEGANALADALNKSSSLKQLYLSSNKIGDNGATALANALTTNTTLTKLYLSNNQIGAEGAKALAKTLTKNNTLKQLYLKNNDTFDEGARAFADALTKNSTLTELSLANNKIDREGGKVLAAALTRNRTLEKLDLYNNNIGKDGANALAEALTKNSTLTKLVLNYNTIGDDGATALADALNKSSSLKQLYLASTNIGNEGGKALADALNKNRTLTVLDLENNIVDGVILNDIRNKLERNKDEREESPVVPGEDKNLRGQRVEGDVSHGNDMLDIEIEAIALADTLAYRSLVPPFVLAILGSWGSGKTYDFGLLRKRFGRIMEIPRGENNPFVGHIYTITFDVWTYSKADLWSSLMFTILSELNKQLQYEKQLENILGPEAYKQGVNLIEIMDQLKSSELEYLEKNFKLDSDKRSEMLKSLKAIDSEGGKNISLALIEAVAMTAKKDRTELYDKKKELGIIETKFKNKRLSLYIQKRRRGIWSDKQSKILDLLSTGVADYRKRKNANGTDDTEEDENGTDDAEEDAWPETADKILDEMKLVPKLWKLFFSGELSSEDLMFVTVMIVLAIVIALVLPIVLEFINDQVTKRIVSLIGKIAPGVLATIYTVLKKIRDATDSIEEVFEKTKKSALQDDQQFDNMESQPLLTGDKDKTLIANLKAEIRTVEERLWLVEGESLDKVVSERLESSGYEKNLGTVHQAKLDIERISESMIRNNDSEKVFPRGKPRIVLFVDDLDRCPQKKVLEVLEALQLLVKTELFVVAVAIDLRYVTLCLEKEYEGILHATDKSKPTGLSYLEKIIQIPYRVPPITEKKTMRAYLKSQCPRTKITSSNNVNSEINPGVVPPPHGDGDSPSEGGENETDNNDGSSSHGDGDSPSEGGENETDNYDGSSSGDGDSTSEGGENETDNNDGSSSGDDSPNIPPLTPTQSPESIIAYQEQELTDTEIDFLADVTFEFELDPRSAKRILNCYKVMKFVWHLRQQQQGIDEPDWDLKQAFMLLMAMGANTRFRPIIYNVLNKLQIVGFSEKPLGELVRKCICYQDQHLLDESCQSFILKYLDPITLKSKADEKHRFRLLRSFSFLGDRDLMECLHEELRTTTRTDKK